MPQQLTLAVERRERGGSTVARRLRHAGKIPAVLYGHGTQPELLAITNRALADLIAHGGRTSLIELQLDGARFDTALVRELQRDPVTHAIVHADLQRVSATEDVHATVPLATNGTAAGVRDFGGVMDVLVHALEVSGAANRLPEHIEVDVSSLGLHEHLTARQIALPEGLKLLTAPDTIVVSIESSKVAKSLEEATTTTEQVEPERIGGTKPETE